MASGKQTANLKVHMQSGGFCYFDYNATTRVAPEVIQAMLPFLETDWGNPSSAYYFGHRTGKSMDEARGRIGRLIDAENREIIFTSCGTESNNSAIHSALVTQPGKRHIVTTAVEHSATMKFCAFLSGQGYEVTYLPVSPEGALDLDLLRDSIRPDTAIVSVMWANNETGILFPVPEISRICRSKSVLFHTDAVQAAGKLPINVREMDVNFLSLSAHKLHAPKGIGVLYVRRGTKFQPYIIGGGQERGRRGGTENVPYIVGFGRAAELAIQNLDIENTRVRSLRNKLESAILDSVTGAQRNGPSEPRLPNTANISFDGVEAEGVLMLLDQAGICASSGSACTTGSLEPSHVLTAMGLTGERARSSLRFSLGIYTTDAEVECVARELPPIIGKLRANAPLQPRPQPSESQSQSGTRQ